MSKPLSILFMIFYVLIITGCSSLPTHSIDGDYQFKQDKGLLVISLANDYKCKPKPYGLNVFISSPDEKLSFAMVSFVKSVDFNSPDGYFYVREMNPGPYKINQFMILDSGNLLDNNKPMDYQWPNNSVATFNIAAGKATYVGQYIISDDCGNKDWFTQRVSNEWERDKGILLSKMPNIDLNNVTIDVMEIR